MISHGGEENLLEEQAETCFKTQAWNENIFPHAHISLVQTKSHGQALYQCVCVSNSLPGAGVKVGNICLK